MRKFKSALSIAVAAAIVVTACGDDDDDDAGGAPTTGGGVATTEGAATTAAAATTSGAATTAGTTGGDCTLDDPLTIGYAADFSDLAGFVDVPGSEAAQVQVDLINEAGGVGGQNVEYIVKELPTDPSAAQRAAQELLDEGAEAIIAPPFSYNGGPLIDTVNGRVPIISNASTDLALADPSRGAFLMTFSDPVQSAAAAEFAARLFGAERPGLALLSRATRGGGGDAHDHRAPSHSRSPPRSWSRRAATTTMTMPVVRPPRAGARSRPRRVPRPPRPPRPRAAAPLLRTPRRATARSTSHSRSDTPPTSATSAGFADLSPGRKPPGDQVDLINEAGGRRRTGRQVHRQGTADGSVGGTACRTGAARRRRRCHHRSPVRLQRRPLDRHSQRPRFRSSPTPRPTSPSPSQTRVRS